MARVIQIVDVGGGCQAERLAGMVARGVGDGDVTVETISVGRGGDEGTVLRGVRRGRTSFGGDPVIAWGERALAVGALGGRGRIVYCPGRFPGARGAGWVRAVSHYRRTDVVASTATMRRALASRGVAAERCHLIRPGVDFATVSGGRNAGLRAELGFAADDFVVLAAGESTREAGHDRAVWATGILHVLDSRNKLLLWGRGAEARKIGAFVRKLGQHELGTLAEERLGRRVGYEALMGVADLVLVTARGPVGTWPIAVAMAAGVPIVSTVTYTVGELLEDRHTALMVGEATPKVIARRIMDCKEDESLRWRIADVARTEAYEFFSRTRFLRQWRAVIGQVVRGEAVSVPEQAAGAGLRFHGRV